MKWLVIGLLLLVVPEIAHSAGVICGRATPLFAGDDVAFWRRRGTADLITCPAPYTKTVLTDAATVASQDTLFATVPQKYLKVSAGLMVEMSGGEKTTVDTTLANADPNKPYIDEIAANNLCDTVALATVVSRIDTIHDDLKNGTPGGGIDDITNIATAITALNNLNDAYAAAFKKIAKCIVARRFVR